MCTSHPSLLCLKPVVSRPASRSLRVLPLSLLRVLCFLSGSCTLGSPWSWAPPYLLLVLSYPQSRVLRSLSLVNGIYSSECNLDTRSQASIIYKRGNTNSQ